VLASADRDLPEQRLGQALLTIQTSWLQRTGQWSAAPQAAPRLEQNPEGPALFPLDGHQVQRLQLNWHELVSTAFEHS